MPRIKAVTSTMLKEELLCILTEVLEIRPPQPGTPKPAIRFVYNEPTDSLLLQCRDGSLYRLHIEERQPMVGGE